MECKADAVMEGQWSCHRCATRYGRLNLRCAFCPPFTGPHSKFFLENYQRWNLDEHLFK